MKPDNLLRQSCTTVDYYMDRGHEYIADLFGIEQNSPEHLDLCKALLPAYLAACAVDFDTAIRANP